MPFGPFPSPSHSEAPIPSHPCQLGNNKKVWSSSIPLVPNTLENTGTRASPAHHPLISPLPPAPPAAVLQQQLQLPSTSPEGRPGLRSPACQPACTSSINSLHTLSIDPACSALSLSVSPLLRVLCCRWAARTACCMIHTNSLTQGNQWARKSAHSKARSLSGDRPRSKETQRTAHRVPPGPGAPWGGKGYMAPASFPQSKKAGPDPDPAPAACKPDPAHRQIPWTAGFPGS